MWQLRPGTVWMRWFVGGLLLLGGSVALARPEIVASGLFEGRALLTIEGAQHLLRVGEASPEGVRLIAANAREAVVEFEGQRITLAPGRAVGGSFETPARREVAVTRDQRHQYSVQVRVNGRPVRAVVDTGASVVALNSGEAQRLGVDYQQRGVASAVRTASGVVPAWSVTLDRVELGGLVVHNVAAAVVEGEHPTEVLLGMSWLGRVTMRETDGVLYLGEK